MKLWVDDIREAPCGYTRCFSVNSAKSIILHCLWTNERITELAIDHDAGDYREDGGDYINLLNFLEDLNISLPLRLISANPVGLANMRAIIEKNGWQEVH